MGGRRRGLGSLLGCIILLRVRVGGRGVGGEGGGVGD